MLTPHLQILLLPGRDQRRRNIWLILFFCQAQNLFIASKTATGHALDLKHNDSVSFLSKSLILDLGFAYKRSERVVIWRSITFLVFLYLLRFLNSSFRVSKQSTEYINTLAFVKSRSLTRSTAAVPELMYRWIGFFFVLRPSLLPRGCSKINRIRLGILNAILTTIFCFP